MTLSERGRDEAASFDLPSRGYVHYSEHTLTGGFDARSYCSEACPEDGRAVRQRSPLWWRRMPRSVRDDRRYLLRRRAPPDGGGEDESFDRRYRGCLGGTGGTDPRHHEEVGKVGESYDGGKQRAGRDPAPPAARAAAFWRRGRSKCRSDAGNYLQDRARAHRA